MDNVKNQSELFSPHCDVKEEIGTASSMYNVGDTVYNIIKEELPEADQENNKNLYTINKKEDGDHFSNSKIKAELVIQHTTSEKSLSSVQTTKSPNMKKQIKSKFTCSLCHTDFTRKENLHHHMGKHNTNPTFRCNICNKNYFSTRSLHVHLKIHNSNNPHTCAKCNEQFSRKSHLDRHNKTKKHLQKGRITSQQNPSNNRNLNKHTCDICIRSYVQKCDLKRHMAMHYNEATKCTICSKVFIRMDKLEEHKRFHTGEKPHGCTICSKKFATKGNLTHHRKTYHMDIQTGMDDNNQIVMLGK